MRSTGHAGLALLRYMALVSQLYQGETEGAAAGDFACPAGGRVCIKGNSFLQRGQRLERVAREALELEGPGEAREPDASEEPVEPPESTTLPPAGAVPSNESASAEPSPNDTDAEGWNGCCAGFGSWPNLDRWVTCNNCKALVLTRPYGNRCDRYCESFGHVCVAAEEEVREDCRVKYSKPCNQPISGTSDMLCTCIKRNAPSGCRPRAPGPAPPPPPNNGRIQVRGRQLLVDGKPIHLKGVAYSPVGRGHRWPEWKRYIGQDAELMRRAGINAVRTYDFINDTSVLDELWAHGIFVINSIYVNWRQSVNEVAAQARMVVNHPAMLMWSVGNEWNYNGLYAQKSDWECKQRIKEVSRVIKSVDGGAHPVSSIYGAVPSWNTIHDLDGYVDIWGLNIYQSLEFGGAFDKYRQRTGKPLFLGEYGADAYNARTRHEDQAAQAEATTVLTQKIVEHSSVRGGDCLGGFIFEWADEWWKDGHGSKSIHDVGGVAPGGGPYPDWTFNEEWWGLVDIDRTPRQAYHAYAQVANPMA